MEPSSPDAASFTLRPIIQDLVRTRFAVPGSIFLVEDIQTIALTESRRWQVIRLLLGDGELCIQALLADAMHRFVHTRDITVGSYVCVQDFQLRQRTMAPDAGEPQQQMVYLVVHDVKTLGCNDEVRRMHGEQQQADEAASPAGSRASTPTKPEPPSAAARQAPGDGDDYDFEDDDDDDMEGAFDEFEALAFPAKTTPPPPPPPPAAQPSKPSLPVALPRDWHDVQTPLKLTTLRAIPNLPYRQNWSCNVLAIVASLSAVESCHLPPYRQRTARITDPSTAKQVHLAVFLDPDEFTPRVGSAVLLTGVKNHRFDGGSLKKYASDRGRGRWWFQDPWELAWCDVRGIKDWWAEMEAYFASQLSEEVVGGDV
ncbi:Cyclin-like F-box, partial [Metarhizium majus ARSEF 297]